MDISGRAVLLNQFEQLRQQDSQLYELFLIVSLKRPQFLPEEANDTFSDRDLAADSKKTECSAGMSQ
jgi:hypothetical protein